MSSGYDQIYKSLVPKLSRCDFSEAGIRLGLSLLQNGAYLLISLAENLFDKNASNFMGFECLAFLEVCLVRSMIMTAQTGYTAGWV